MKYFGLTMMKQCYNLLHLRLYYGIFYCKIDMKHFNFNPVHRNICSPAVFLHKILF